MNKLAATPPPTLILNMNTYYAGRGGGCFSGLSSVTVVKPDGSDVVTPVAFVCPGDLVRAGCNATARVQCVVQIVTPPNKRMVSLPGGLAISRRHPVHFAGEWQLPCNVPGVVECESCNFVYNFVLNQNHTVLVNGIRCVTWGHGMEGRIVGHPYYGTNCIIQDLATSPGWSSGFVHVEGWFRDRFGQVAGLRAVEITEKVPRIQPGSFQFLPAVPAC